MGSPVVACSGTVRSAESPRSRAGLGGVDDWMESTWTSVQRHGQQVQGRMRRARRGWPTGRCWSTRRCASSAWTTSRRAPQGVLWCARCGTPAARPGVDWAPVTKHPRPRNPPVQERLGGFHAAGMRGGGREFSLGASLRCLPWGDLRFYAVREARDARARGACSRPGAPFPPPLSLPPSQAASAGTCCWASSTQTSGHGNTSPFASLQARQASTRFSCRQPRHRR